MLEGMFDWFQAQGLMFTLLGMLIIVIVDSTLFPVLPELFAVLVFTGDPSPELAAMMMTAICLGEITGNTVLYSLVKWKHLPAIIEKAIVKWTDFLIFSDERIILMNRFAPVIPYAGAFIATCKWNYRKAMIYLVTGCIVKYSALFALVGFFNYQFDPKTAQMFSLVAVITVICLSLVASAIYRKRRNQAAE
jgi:membrane protein DedA with SNARE-associated domain